MSHPAQFLLDSTGKPQFAVLPYDTYVALVKAAGETFLLGSQESLLSPDRTKIKLPHGGPGAYLDLVAFAHYWNKRGWRDMAINQRAQSLEKFPTDQENTLDPFIRRHFLPGNSPYKNTMQAVAAVVDALVESGLFTRIKKRYPFFYRPVNAIESRADSFKQYLSEQGEPTKPIEE